MGQDGASRHDPASEGKGPDDDDRVLQPDGSFRRPPSPRGGVRGVIDDLFADQSPIDRRLSLLCVAGFVVIPLLWAVAASVFRIGFGHALLLAWVIYAAILAAPVVRSFGR